MAGVKSAVGTAGSASHVRGLLIVRAHIRKMRCLPATVLRALIAYALFSACAMAGPWAREPGDIFLSFSISAEDSRQSVMLGVIEPDSYLSAYGEVGLGRRLTFGLDYGRGTTSQMAVAFLRYTLTPPDAAWQVAVDGGVGARQFGAEEVRDAQLVRLGASVGRGFGEIGGQWWMPLSFDGGWATLDLGGLYDIDTAEVIWQAEGTLGLTLSDRFRGIFSVKVEEWPGSEMMVTIMPSLVYDLNGRTAVQLGARTGVMGSDAVGLSLSLWQEF